MAKIIIDTSLVGGVECPDCGADTNYDLFEIHINPKSSPPQQRCELQCCSCRGQWYTGWWDVTINESED